MTFSFEIRVKTRQLFIQGVKENTYTKALIGKFLMKSCHSNLLNNEFVFQ